MEEKNKTNRAVIYSYFVQCKIMCAKYINRISGSFVCIHLSHFSWKRKKQLVTCSCKAWGVCSCFLDRVLGHSGFSEHLHQSCGAFCSLFQTYSHPAGSAGRGAGWYTLFDICNCHIHQSPCCSGGTPRQITTDESHILYVKISRCCVFSAILGQSTQLL